MEAAKKILEVKLLILESIQKQVELLDHPNGIGNQHKINEKIHTLVEAYKSL